MDRIDTGIPGLDLLIAGGMPKGFNVLVVGHPGTGKTIFGLQYLYNGALKGENGLFVILDADAESVRSQGDNFGWDIRKLETEKKLHILAVPLNRQLRLNLFKLIEDRVKQYDIKRIVFDSLSSFMFNINQFKIRLPHIDDLSTLSDEEAVYLEEEIGVGNQPIPEAIQRLKPDPMYYKSSTKRIIYLMFREFSKIGTTNIIITGGSYGGEGKLTVDEVSEFVADGLIQLETVELGGGPSRACKVLKLRQTKNSMESHSFEITNKGIVIG